MRMFELIFLGTSSSAPTITRGLAGHIILHRHYRFLLDCGEGTQRQILRSGLGFKRLDTVLLTHGHLDHILGLGGLVSTLARWENLDHIDIYGGRATLGRVSDLLFKVVFAGHRPPIDIDLHPIEPGDVVCADEKFSLMDMVMNAVRENKVTVLFVEHDMEVVEKYTHRILAFYEGRIIADGEPANVLNDVEVRRYVIGEHVPAAGDTAHA